MSRERFEQLSRAELAENLEAIFDLAERGLGRSAPGHWRAALEAILQRMSALTRHEERPPDARLPSTPVEAAPDDRAGETVVSFDAARLAESVAEMMANRQGQRAVELISLVGEDLPRTVTGPPGTVRRILVELLDNALRFTDTGQVTLSCSWSDGLRVEVADTGPGIPPVEVDRLYSAPHRPHGGIWLARAGEGMGLALCSALAKSLGGRLECRSQLGIGTTFRLDLPLPAADTRQRPLPDRIEGRVLLVEDHRQLRAGLARALEDLGFLVDEVGGGREALRAVRRATGTYDLALLDAELEDAPGRALLDLIGDRPSLDGVSRISMTRAAGGDGLEVCKPVTRWRLERAVERALGRRLIRRTVGVERNVGEGERRLLLVDDNPDSRRLAARALEAHHYRVDLAADGVQAVEAAGRVPYDLILMDVEMPRLGGLEATRRIRRAEREGNRVPIVAMTAHDDVGFRTRCIEAGMDDHVPRPIRTDRLLRVVERALGVIARVGPPTPPPPTVDPLDVLPPVALDPDVGDLLPDFVARRRADVVALRRWIEGDEVDARSIAHDLKGVGGAYGFPAITTLGALLGAALRAKARERAIRCIERLDEHIGQIEAALAAAHGAGPPDGSR